MAWTTFPAGLFTAGQILTAAQLNTYVRDNLNTIGDAWTAFTPALTNLTGTAAGRYVKAGRLVVFEVNVTVTAVTGIIGIALPFTAVAARSAGFNARLQDVGTNIFSAICDASTTRVDIYAQLTSATYGLAAATSSTVPFTWGANDIVQLSGTYEAAA
jgi:hypothetical protein